MYNSIAIIHLINNISNFETNPNNIIRYTIITKIYNLYTIYINIPHRIKLSNK